MAVAFDAVSSATPTAGTTSPHTWTHTGVGSNLAVVAAICLDEATSGTTVACTYNGVSMTLIGSLASGTGGNNGFLYLFGIANAPTGAQTVSFTFSGTTDVCVGATVSWTGAGNTFATAFGNFQPVTPATGQGSTANPGLAVTCHSTTSQAFCAIASGANPITSMGGGAQRFLDSNTSAGQCGSIVGSNATGVVGNINFTSVIAAGTFAIAGVEILPPASAGVPPQPGSKNWRRQHRRKQTMLSAPPQATAPITPAPVYPLLGPARARPGPFARNQNGRGYSRSGLYAGPKFATLIDDFQRNDFATLWPSTVGTVRWSPGQCAIQLDTSYSSGLGTPVFYDLTGSYLYLHLSAYVSTSTQSSIQLSSQTLPNYGFFFGFSSSNLNMTKVINGVQTTIYNSGSYNAVTMAWIRVRESNGTVFLDQAPDGVTWTNVFSTPDSTFVCPLTALSVDFFCGDFGADPTGTTYCYAINCVPGPPVYAMQRPARAPVPATFSRGRTISHAGTYTPPAPRSFPLDSPVRSRLPGPTLHGRVIVQRGVYDQLGPPVYPIPGPVSGQIARRGPPPTLHGRAISRVGTLTTPAVVITTRPLGPVRSHTLATPRGRAITRTGVYDQLGAPVTPLSKPVKAQPQFPRLAGRAIDRVGTFTAPPAAPPAPQHGPTRARILPTFSKGRAISRAGVYDQVGAQVYPLEGPIRSRVPAVFSRGRAITRTGVYDQVGPPLTPLRGPVRSHVPASLSRGRAVARSGVFEQTGPQVRVWSGPVRAAWSITFSRGRAITRVGAFEQSGPPVKALRGPVRAPIPATFSRGRTTSRTGIYDQLGTQVYPLQGPAGLGRRAPGPVLHGRAITRVGTFTSVILTSGPPVYPLPGAHARPQYPVLHGRTISRTGTFTLVTFGPPITPLHSPVRAPVPAAFSRGRAITRVGVYDQVGPPVRPLQRPVRAPVPTTFSRGREFDLIGPFRQTGPPVKPLRGPVRAAWPARTLTGREIDRSGVYDQIGAPAPPLHGAHARPQYPVLYGRVISRVGTYSAPPPPSAIPGTVQPLATRQQPRRSATRAYWRGGLGVHSAISGRVQPLATRPSRRTSTRVTWRGTIVATQRLRFTGTVQSPATRLPRRTSSRLTWLGTLGGIFRPRVTGTVQPSSTRQLARRAAARAVWRQTTPALNVRVRVSGTVQPLPTRQQPRRPASRVHWLSSVPPLDGTRAIQRSPGSRPQPRRTATRVTWRGTVLSAGARTVPGTVQPAATRQLPRRTRTRVLWHGLSATQPPSGTVQPVPTRQQPRRRTARAVVRSILNYVGHAPYPVGNGTVQPAATRQLPRRKTSRVLWRSSGNIIELELSAAIKIAFNVQQLVSSSPLGIAFNVQQSAPFGQALLSDQPWISPYSSVPATSGQPFISPFNSPLSAGELPFISLHDSTPETSGQPFISPQDGTIRAGEQPWVSPQDATIRMSDQPTTWMQGGNR